ncbi:MAG: sulfur carrier protein ThiS [Desulfuromonadaceae bacterium]
MQITLNGKTRDIDSVCTISDLLLMLNLKAGQVAVEHNRNIVTRTEFDTCVLKDGDRVEIVNFVGGG